MRPGAYFGAVIPPAFTVPHCERVVGAIIPAKDDLYHLDVSALDSGLTRSTSFLNRPPSVLISALGSVALSVCWPITNHWSAALAAPAPNRMADAATMGKYCQILDLYVHVTLLLFA